MAAGDGLLGASCLDRRCYGATGVGDADDIHTATNDDALSFKAIEENSNAFRIVISERLRSLEHGHRATKPAEGLAQFQPDGPRADDDKVLRPIQIGRASCRESVGSWQG